ncbi:MAG: flagellar basal body rod protein [bacterium]|nr:flagellar basal body rod protein [bacterium]
MQTSGLSKALSGIHAAKRQIRASSHNVANMLTEGFRPLRSHQSEVQSGGARTTVTRSTEPSEVDLAREIVTSNLAAVQARASARALETELGLIGGLLDIRT